MSGPRRLRENCNGAAAVELALVAPIFILLIFGMIVYGSWFSLAQAVQTLATESARASIGGLDQVERQALALGYLEARIGSSGLDADHVVQTVDVTESVTTVTIQLDVSEHPVMAFSQIIPSPPPIIRRSAVVLSGRA